MESQRKPVHLLTCIHGMWGEPSHVARLGEVMKEAYGARIDMELDVLTAETNRDSHTYDGVDWGAERVVKEIKERISLIENTGTKKVTHISVIGYSLGGLVARYAVGILHSESFFKDVVPVNFATIATPNIGLLRYETFFSRMAFRLGPTVLSRTGKHFYATDGEWGDQGRPLLEAMSQKDGVFYRALASFKRVIFLANAVNDLTVPFISSAVEPVDFFVVSPRQGVDIELDEKYAPIIKSYTLSSTFIVKAEKPKPAFLSSAWWKLQRQKPSRLPPPLQFRPPYNILVWVMSPVLLPLLFMTLFGVVSYNALKSQKRIKLLETSHISSRSALMDMIRSIEAEVEGVVVDMMDDGPNGPISGATSAIGTPARSTTPNPLSTAATKRKKLSASGGKLITYSPLNDPFSPYMGNDSTSDSPQNQPKLSDAQKRMITNLNTLPNLEKAFVFLDKVRNSHATIVCRDVKNFDFHKRGEGGLRYLADHFEI